MRAVRLDGRTALVTGGGSGLGRYFAQVLAGAGAKVILAGRRHEVLLRAAEALRTTGAVAEVLELDVRDEASVTRAVERCFSSGGAVDVLVNNAGLSRPGPALELASADWDAILETNLRGAFLLARAVATRLISGGRSGAIVNVCSVLGFAPQKGVAPYGVSKAGLLHLTRLLALEWARYDIRVNALVPGYVRTDITEGYLETEAGRAMRRRIPQRRLGELSDLAWPLLLLASDASRYMTGSQLVVDGGLSANPL